MRILVVHGNQQIRLLYTWSHKLSVILLNFQYELKETSLIYDSFSFVKSYYYPTAQRRVQISRQKSTNTLQYCTVI